MQEQLRRPPREANPEGGMRRVGVEIEFGGLEVAAAADLVRELFGGEVRQSDRHRFVVEGTAFGAFTVELDSKYAHPPDEGEGAGAEARLQEKMAPLVGDVMRFWMPNEVVAPPVPFERLPELDRLIGELRRKKANGTGRSLVASFSLQLNIEVAASDAVYLTRHLQAYLLLSPWLRARLGRDLLRRALGWASPFPESYLRRVLDPGYRPDLGALLADYLDANPTRNRELDLLPLFAHLAPEALHARVHDAHVKGRPAFHWRLPDSRVDEPAWGGVVAQWNQWVVVERLAEDAARLERAVRDFQALPAGAAGLPQDRLWQLARA